MRVREVVVTLSTLAVVGVGSLQARVWPVPGPGTTTIQLGLDSARTNDTVLVSPGVYAETLNWPNRASIKLLSELGPDTTIIDASSWRRVITMPNYLGPTTVIDGFTIKGGWATPPRQAGAGICCDRTGPLIRGNVITANSAGGNGGGIYCYGASTGLTILDNVISANGANIGGGVSCEEGASPMIYENFFHQNVATRSGAIDCWVLSSPWVYRNRLLGNSANAGISCGLNDNYTSDPPTHWNSLVENVTYEIASSDVNYPVPAEQNWWGTDSPAGRVTGPVDYTPWLRSPLIFDIAAESVTSPPDTVAPESSYVPRVLVRNRGYCDSFQDPDSVDVTFFTATCVIGDYRKYVRVDGTVHQGSTFEVAFPAWTIPLDSGVECTMKVWLHYAPDMDSSNDTISKRVIAFSVGVKDGAVKRGVRFSLDCRPGVFRDAVAISVGVPDACLGKLEIVDVAGRPVRAVANGVLPAGKTELRWDGADMAGVPVAPGVYFCRLQAGGLTATRKLVLQR
jgi:hypothetical protein